MLLQRALFSNTVPLSLLKFNLFFLVIGGAVFNIASHGPLIRYVISRVAHAPGMPGTFSPPPRVSDPDMHHGTCVTHVPWCMPGSLTSGFLWSRRRGKTFPAFPAHAQPAILRIWLEAHWVALCGYLSFFQSVHNFEQLLGACERQVNGQLPGYFA